MTRFTYTAEQRNAIMAVVRDGLGKDADQIECQVITRFGIPGTQSLWSRIDTAANAHIPRSAVESQTTARIKRLNKLRDRTKALGDDIIDAFTPGIPHDRRGGVKLLLPGAFRPSVGRAVSTTGRAIATLLNLIDAYITPQRLPTASKKGRDRFWNEVVAIWIDIGGEKTGAYAEDFVIAVSNPVFDKVRADGGHKTTASMPLNRKSVGEWLRLRARRQRRPVS